MIRAIKQQQQQVSNTHPSSSMILRNGPPIRNSSSRFLNLLRRSPDEDREDDGGKKTAAGATTTKKPKYNKTTSKAASRAKSDPKDDTRSCISALSRDDNRASLSSSRGSSSSSHQQKQKPPRRRRRRAAAKKHVTFSELSTPRLESLHIFEEDEYCQLWYNQQDIMRFRHATAQLAWAILNSESTNNHNSKNNNDLPEDENNSDLPSSYSSMVEYTFAQIVAETKKDSEDDATDPASLVPFENDDTQEQQQRQRQRQRHLETILRPWGTRVGLEKYVVPSIARDAKARRAALLEIVYNLPFVHRHGQNEEVASSSSSYEDDLRLACHAVTLPSTQFARVIAQAQPRSSAV